MSEFWIGVLVVPGAVVALGAAYCVFNWLVALGGLSAAGFVRMVSPESDQNKRAGMAGVLFGSKRAFMLGSRDCALVFIQGTRPGEVRRARTKLTEVDIEQVTAVAHPRRRSKEG